MTSRSLPAAIVSASTASAPIGVRSSWLTLATKSRRMLSIRRASVTSRTNATAPLGAPSCGSGNARRCSVWRGRPEENQLALGGLTEQRLVEQLADRLLGDRVGVARAAEAARGRVAHEHLPVAPDDHHAVGHRVQRGREPVAVDAQAVGVGFELGEHRVDPLGRRRRRVAIVRLGERATRRSSRRALTSTATSSATAQPKKTSASAVMRRSVSSSAHPNLPVM